MVWQNESTSQVSVWYMGGAQGTVFLNSDWIWSHPITGWRIVGAADFNADNKPDLVWQNDTSGEVSVWYMTGAKGNVFAGWTWLSTMVLPEWKVVAIGDLDSNGTPDLVWQHEATRQVSYWRMHGFQGSTFIGSLWLSESPVPGWRVVGCTDVNGDGKLDLLWQNDATQQASLWFMGGNTGNQFLHSTWLAESGVNGWRLISP